jgi:hypothetical protein
VSADAKTSAGAPLVICVARVFDPAKLYVTVTFGLAASNFVFISPNAAVSEAAPKTLIVTGAGVGVVEPLLLLLPQEANNMHAATSKNRMRGKCFMIDSLMKIMVTTIQQERILHQHANISESVLPLNYLVEYSTYEYMIKKLARMK